MRGGGGGLVPFRSVGEIFVKMAGFMVQRWPDGYWTTYRLDAEHG